MDGVCVRDDPVTASAGTKTSVTVTSVTIVNVHRPEKLLGCATAIVFEKIISPPGGTAAGRLVNAKVKDVVVIQPGMVAWVVVKIANIRPLAPIGQASKS
jgi:hypothetical protein